MGATGAVAVNSRRIGSVLAKPSRARRGVHDGRRPRQDGDGVHVGQAGFHEGLVRLPVGEARVVLERLKLSIAMGALPAEVDRRGVSEMRLGSGLGRSREALRTKGDETRN